MSAGIIFRKEVRDHLRDRSMLTALLMPLMGPFMFAAIFTVVASWNNEDKPIKLPVAGALNAPNLVSFLTRHGVEVTPAPANYEDQVRDGDLDCALSIPEDYGKEFQGGRSAPVQLIVDNSRNKTRGHVRRVQRLLEGYSQQLASLRLIARGIAPQLAAPVEINEVDLATPEKIAANLLAMVPFFLLMAVFVGGMHVAIDTTAGERERGSLEPLLVNPVSRQAVVLGKWFATVSTTWLALCVTLVAFLFSLRHMPLQDLGVKLSLGPREIAGLLLLMLPLGLFTSALQMLLAFYAKSFKEAQTYLSLLMLVPTLPAAFLTLTPLKATATTALVPVLGQTLLMAEVLRGEWPSAVSMLVAALVAATAAALCLMAAVRLLANERIVFGKS